MIASLAHQHLPDHAVGDGLLGLVPLVGGRGLRADLQNALGLPHGGRELLGFLDSVAHRLFDVHVFAAVHGFEGDLGVPVIGRGDQHRVDIRTVDDLAIIQRALAFALLGVLAGALAVDVAHRDDLAAIIALADIGELAREVGTATAYADNADINAVVGADYTARRRFAWTRSERSASHSQRCANLGRVLHELSSINGVIVHGDSFLCESCLNRLNKLYTLLSANVNTDRPSRVKITLLGPLRDLRDTLERALSCFKIKTCEKVYRLLGLGPGQERSTEGMKTLAMSMILTGAMLSGGCATKKFVRNTTAPIQAKVDQVGEQGNRNATATEENKKEIKSVDERAESGISAAKERAMTAENKAGEAMNKATEAGNIANTAVAKADKNSTEIASIRNIVANIDDYKPVAETTVNFAFGKDKLSKEAQESLDKLATDKGNLKRFVVAVEGFTDKIGSPDYNTALSQRRANAVVNYMVTKHDIPLYRIYMVGLGSQKPADEGKTREARSKNRRVEVKIYSADQTMASASAASSN